MCDACSGANAVQKPQLLSSNLVACNNKSTSSNIPGNFVGSNSLKLTARPLIIGRAGKSKQSYSKHPCSGAFAVSFREAIFTNQMIFVRTTRAISSQGPRHHNTSSMKVSMAKRQILCVDPIVYSLKANRWVPSQQLP